MKRKILMLCLLCLLCLLLTGCGKEKKIGLCLAGDSLWAELEAPLEEAGYSVTAENAVLDQAVQNRQLEKLLAEEYDLVILEPVMTAQTPEIAKKCEQAGIPVLFVGYAPAPEALAGNGTAHIGLQTESAGTVQGQLVSRLSGADLNGDGMICYAVIAGPEGDMDAMALTEGCHAALPGNCLGVYHGEWTREAGEISGGKLLATWGKDLEVVLCNSYDLALGAVDAMEDAGRTVGEDIFLVSVGGGRTGKLLVKSGDFSATAVPDMNEIQRLVLEAVKALLSGKSVEKQQYGKWIPITAENVESYLDS